MKKGINAWSFTNVCDNVRDMIDLSKKAGFEGLFYCSSGTYVLFYYPNH